MSTLIWKDLRHHASEWLWSLLVATVGGTIVGVVITSWWSAVQWSLAHPDGPYMLASNILGSNMVGYIGISTAIVISTTLGLTVTAQQRSYALWKVLGIPGRRIRSVILWQVCAVGLVGGLLGGLLALPTARVYLLTWREFNLFPDDLPLSMPLFGIPATMLVTALFSVLGGLGAARRAGNVPEMQALREATSPRSRTKLWQWIAAGFFLIPVVLMPILINLPPEALHSDYTPEMPDVPTEAATTDFESPGDRAVLGGGIGLMVTLAALFIPNWTVRPLLIGWTSLIPGRSPAWFAARANARHRSAFSLTTIVPFAIAVAMTGVFHTVANAGRAAGGMHGGVNGFLTIIGPDLLRRRRRGHRKHRDGGTDPPPGGSPARGDRSPVGHDPRIHDPGGRDLRHHRNPFRAGRDPAQRHLRCTDVRRRDGGLHRLHPGHNAAARDRSIARAGHHHHVATRPARPQANDGEPAPAGLT